MPDPPEDEQHFEDDTVFRHIGEMEETKKRYSEDKPDPPTPPERESEQESDSE